MINYNKLKKAAKSGRFFVRLKINDNDDMRKLIHDGFVLSELGSSTDFPKTFKVSWKHAKIECDNIEIINENMYKYTLPEKLWIIAKKATSNNY